MTQCNTPKNNQKLPAFHGSDIAETADYFHLKPENMISFAANVNPLGISYLLKETLANELEVISSYPERDYHTLRTAIGNYVHISADSILVGNGSTELISGVIHTICPKDAILIAPSYSEYEREVGLCGGTLRYHELKADLDFHLDVDSLIADFSKNTDLIILCNPNNPTGNAVDVKSLTQLLDACKSQNILLMIDETYIEFSRHPKDIEAIPLTENYDNLIVLRGISKFFAAPGLRLGYAVCSNTRLRDAINQNKNPWTINSLAAKAGEIMFNDTDYIKKTKQLINEEKEKMTLALSETRKVKVYPSESNFLFLELLDTNLTSTDCFIHCAKQGMMLRDCSSFPYLDKRFLRICMMLPEDNLRLINALKEIL